MFKKAIILLFIPLLITSCASKKIWYMDYGLAESELYTDKAIIVAARAIGSGDRSAVRGAAHYLKTSRMTEKQASLLVGQITDNMSDYSKRAIADSLVHHGHNKIAYPLMKEGLLNRNSRGREFSIRKLGNLGCDAKDALPMLEVISKNDSRGHQKVARIARREITLDCMAKNIKVDGQM